MRSGTRRPELGTGVVVRTLGSRGSLALALAAVLTAVALVVFYVVSGLAANPQITTDAPSYIPYSTVHMTGTGMNPGTSYDVVTIRPDGSIVTGDSAHNPIPPAPYDTAVADSTGTFSYSYLLTAMQGFYTVKVYMSSDTTHATLIATTTFEDAVLPNLDQCANGSPPFIDLHCNWQNGDLNSSNSDYLEAQAVPFRLNINGFTSSGTHTIHLNYDFSNSAGIKGYDFLTKYNVTQSGADPCSGSAAAPTLCSGPLSLPLAPPQCFAFPSDPFAAPTLTVSGAETASGLTRCLGIYGGTITSITTPAHSPSVWSGGASAADMTVTFTNTGSSVLLVWGGHLAFSGYWGTGQGAGNINGAPIHMRTQMLDGDGNKNQDRSLQPSGLATPTPTATNTPLPTATNTPLPPTATNTPLPPTATNTPLPPTATNTPLPTATNTPLPPTATNTPLPPTATNTPLPPTATNTPLPPTATNTPVPTATNTPLPTATNTPLPTATSTPTPGPSTVQWFKTPGAVNLFITAGTPVFTFDEVLVNQTDPHGLGGFSFDVHFDPTVFQQPSIDLAPAVALFAASGRTLNCNMSIPLNGIVHMACASTGPIGVGPVFTGPKVIAHVTLTPQDAVLQAIRPNKENGVVSVVKDDQVTVANTCGQPLNDGSIQPLPGQPECQGIPLPGVGPGGVLTGNPNGGKTTATIRRLEGDVVPDCAVNIQDMQLEASKFGTSVGNLPYTVFFDVNEPTQFGDGHIDVNDVQFVFGRFGSTCQIPVPPQNPQAAP